MIIYQIKNKINSKSYIGQTINEFNDRYTRGEWWGCAINNYLKNAVAKYGKDNFEVIILENDVPSIKKLNKLEKYYIKKFKTLVPNGYNLRSGGENSKLHIDSIRKLSKNQRGDWEFKFRSPEGVIYEADVLAHFCDKHGLDHASMSRLARGTGIGANGTIIHHKGWTNANEEITQRSFVSPTGEVFKVKNLYGYLDDFYRAHGLTAVHMQHVWHGRVPHHKGWTKLGADIPEKDVKYILKSPTGELHAVSVLHSFCIAHNLIRPNVHKLVHGKRKTCQGWTLVSKNDHWTNKKFVPTTNNKKRKSYSFISPTNEIHHTDNITKFALTMNLRPEWLHSISSGKRKEAKGWKKASA